MYTENSKSIITFKEPTQPLLYSANNTQEHDIIDAMSPILPIVLKYNYDNTQEHYTIDAISPSRKTNTNKPIEKKEYNKSSDNILKELGNVALLFSIVLLFLLLLYLALYFSKK